MTEGERIALEYIGPGPEAADARATLARRIDAALAAVEAEREKYRAMWAADASGCIEQAARVWECDPNVDVTLNVEEAIDRLQAALAEREAQIAARTRQVERWQHAAHESGTSDALRIASELAITCTHVPEGVCPQCVASALLGRRRRPAVLPLGGGRRILYSVVTDGSGHLGILCARCGLTSWNPTDLREAYCGRCHDFLTEGVDWPPERAE